MSTMQLKNTLVEKQDLGYNIMDVDSEQRRVKAVWARCGNIDLDNDIIVPEAFTKTLAERGPGGKNLIWSLVDHCADMNNVIGKPEQIYVENDMLIAITPIVETEKGEDIIKMYEAGLINQHSIGFSTMKSNVDKEGVRTITELKLYEGSAVLWGANPETPTLGFKGEMVTKDKKQELSNRLERLIKSFKGGKFTDEMFSLIEIEIKRIQSELLEIEVIKEITQTVEETFEPAVEEKKENNEQILKAINQFNNLFKK
jgi:HK97 family phage prohead protease